MNGRIILHENSGEDTMALEKYAFSNALALSGKKRALCCILLLFVVAKRVSGSRLSDN